jgi:hypothetical protein
VDEEQGIYRGEVRAIMLGLTPIGARVERLLGYFEGVTVKKKRRRREENEGRAE